MNYRHSDTWFENVAKVFDTRPRIAIDDLSRWMQRKEEKKFRAAAVSPGLHVCLYGPSGSGKTSLAKSILGRLQNKREKVIYTRLNHNSTWNSFKSQIIEHRHASHELSRSFGLKIGIKSLIPYMELSGNMNNESFGGIASHADLLEAIEIPTLSQFVIENDIILAIDDVNFANDDLLKMLTSFAKEITDNAASSKAKIIFVGADDIFYRIVKINDSLRDRTEEISLGSVRDDDEVTSMLEKNQVWNFIADGLVYLGLVDPRKDSHFTRDQRNECIKWIEHAADGLPKSIITLGRKIAEKGEGRSRISHSDIMSSAQEMTRRNFRNY